MQRVGQKLLVNGMQIFYEKVGKGSQVLLLMPGVLGTSKTDFDIQLETLNRNRFTIIAWDPPGYGYSRPPNRKFTHDHWHQDAEIAADLMKTLGYSKYSLLGWSNGGLSASILAARYNNRVEKLIIWGVSCYITMEEVEIMKKLSDVSKLSMKNVAPYVEVYGEKLFKEMWKESSDLFITLGESGHLDIFVSEVPNIHCDTLIIHGDKDVLVPKFHAEYLHKHIKHSRLVCWQDGKHNLHIRFPERFNTLVEDFLQTKSFL